MKKRLVAILILLTFLAAVMVWSVLTGKTPSPVVQARFLGYTNGSTGPLGMFVLSNSSATPHIIVGYYAVQISGPKGMGPWMRGTNASGASLPAHYSKTVTVPAPDHGPWHVSFSYRIDNSDDTNFDAILSPEAASVGVPTRYCTFEVQSDWIAK